MPKTPSPMRVMYTFNASYPHLRSATIIAVCASEPAPASDQSGRLNVRATPASAKRRPNLPYALFITTIWRFM